MSEAMLILGMMSVTWGVRAAPFVLRRLTISPGLLKFLNCVPAAVLAALISEPILNPVVTEQAIIQPELIAAAICLVFGYFGAPMLLTVLIGMTSFWLLGYVL